MTTDAIPTPQVIAELPKAPAEAIASLDTNGLTRGLLPLAYEMSMSIDSARAMMESAKLTELQKFGPGSDGHEAAKHYAKGLVDALIILSRAREASIAFRKWTNDMNVADAAAKASGK